MSEPETKICSTDERGPNVTYLSVTKAFASAGEAEFDAYMDAAFMAHFGAVRLDDSLWSWMHAHNPA